MNLNLESKINLIYQFLHEDLENDCYNISRINLKNIKIDDIKIPLNFKNRTEILDNFMEGKFQFLNQKEDISKFRRISDTYNCSVNIMPYMIDENEDNLDLPNNNDALFSYVLSSLVLQEKTNNIQLPLLNIDVKFSEIEKIFKSYPIYNEIKDKINSDIIKDTFSLRVKEHFFPSVYFSEYIEENNITRLKEILFQIFHCLAVIQNEYSSFRHNNLNLDTIIIEKDNRKSDKKYIIDGNQYIIKGSKVTVKLGLFENATCTDINTKSSKNNKYRDIYTLLKNIKHSTIYSKLDDESKKFMNDNLKSDSTNEYITSNNILKNNYFNAYKKISNDSYMSNKYNNFSLLNLESDNKTMFGNQSELDELSSLYSDIKLVRKEKKSTKDNYNGSRNVNKKESKRSSKKRSVKSSRTLRTNQSGGEFRKTNNPYKKERNDPHVSNDARDTHNKFKQEKPYKPYEPPILAEQKIYDVQKSSKPGKPQDYVPGEIPVNNLLNGQYHPLYPYESQANKVHIVKPMNITFSNPVSGNHMALNRVYEDMLPGDNYTYSLKSVYERSQLINFLRGMILEKGDGEEISITTGGYKSLLSFIKLIEINPYNLEKNPYKSLSKGFLLYNSAYPVRYDTERNHLGVAKQSLGINVRIYQLTRGAYEAEKIGKNIDCDNFDVWREIKYYEYVREDIMKMKISPNFVTLYLYTTDSNSKINYDEINTIRLKGTPSNELIKEQDNIYKINKLHEIDPLQFITMNSSAVKFKQYNDTNGIIKDKYEPTQEKINNMASYLYKRNYIKSENSKWNWTSEGIQFIGDKNYYNLDFTGKEKPTIDSAVHAYQIKKLIEIVGKVDFSKSIGKSLVVLTESPTSPLLVWASPSSENFGTVQKMTETGYHTPEVWRSIIFQMIYTLSVLQEHNIYFKKMSIENNFFIKDLFSNNEKRDHWIYKVDGVEYYIPNYGYLLMFDSKNVDIMSEHSKTIGVEPSDKLLYKIQSENLYKKKNNPPTGISDSSGYIHDLIYDAFTDIINPDNFTNSLDRFGGLKPDDSVTDLLTNISNYYNPNKTIKNVLSEFFTEFMHNKIGSRLTNDEMSIIGNMYINNFKKGELVAYRKGNGEYIWGIYLGPGTRIRRVKIALNDGVNEISIGSLRKLPASETIKQDTKNRVLYDSHYTIETYTLK